MTDEQELDWQEYIERVWVACAKRAASKSGGVVMASADLWGVYGTGGRPRIELQAAAENQVRESPLKTVEDFERWVAELRKEVIEAMAAGKFDFRIISTAESLRQHREMKEMVP